jgi:hypothetical protein
VVKTLKIEDIKPRGDANSLFKMIQEFCDNCDPQDRIDLKITVAIG